MRNGPYILVKAPDDYPGKTYRGARRYVYEHQLVWWQETGEVAPDGHVVHHKNDNKHDNRFENLELQTRARHTSEHNPAECNRVERVAVECGWCEKEFEIIPWDLRRRMKASETKSIYCSRSCGMKASWDRRSRG